MTTEQREINGHILTDQMKECINVVRGVDMKDFTFASPDQGAILCAVKKFITDKYGIYFCINTPTEQSHAMKISKQPNKPIKNN